jgi:hypothetical protein
MEEMGRSLQANASVSAWNATHYKRLSLSDRSGLIRAYARTQNDEAGMSYQNLYLVFDGDYTFAKFVRERPDRSVEWDGSDFIVTAQPAPHLEIRAATFGVRLHLDPARAFMPNRVVYLLHGETVPQSEWTNELYEPSPGVWVPRRATIKVFLHQKDSPLHGSVAAEKTVEIDTEQSHFNVAIDRALFDLQFPPGVKVLDEATSTQFLSGPRGTETDLIELAAAARQAMEDLRTSPSTWSPRRLFLICLNVSVVLGLALALAVRRWRDSPQT